MHGSRSGAIFDGSGNPEIIRFRLYPFKIIFLAPSRLQKCKKNRFFWTNKVDNPLKDDRALSKSNFLFHLESKNLVTLCKCNSHSQYYKIDLCFSIKLQEINLYVCEEYKTDREVRDANRTEHKARYENVPAKRADSYAWKELSFFLKDSGSYF